MKKNVILLVITLSVAVSYGAVDGVVGVSVVEVGTVMTARLDVPDGKALVGIKWFHNDQSVAFPKIALSAGVKESHPSTAGSISVAVNQSGGSLSWSTCWIDRGYTSETGCIDVLFSLPQGSVHSHDGYGGGAGLGYMSGGQGLSGWVSIDGNEWVRFSSDYSFAVEPLFEDDDGLAVVLEPGAKSLEGGGDSDEGAPLVLEAPVLAVTPNPFNPRTKIQFSLDQSGHVDIIVYDLQGRLVRKLATGFFSAGGHEILWDGTDAAGRKVASGSYLATLRTPTQHATKRMTLVR